MSVQTSSGRHRAGRLRLLRARVHRFVRCAERARKRLAVYWSARQPRKAGAAYFAELLTPAPRAAVNTLHLPAASVGYYAPTYTAAAPRVWDEVRVTRHLFPAHNGHIGVVVAINGSVRSIVVEVPGVGTLYCEPNELELLDRPAERTLTMGAVVTSGELERVW